MQVVDDLGHPFESTEEPSIQRMAAESYAARVGVSFEDALAAMDFQDAAHRVLETVQDALGEQAAGVWFSNSSENGCRLVFGVADAGDPPSGDRVDHARQIVRNARMLGRCDFVAMNVSERAAEEAALRAREVLTGMEPYAGAAPMLDTAAPMWRVQITIPENPTPPQLRSARAAARAAGLPATIDHPVQARPLCGGARRGFSPNSRRVESEAGCWQALGGFGRVW
jgi:hypothetical protein